MKCGRKSVPLLGAVRPPISSASWKASLSSVRKRFSPEFVNRIDAVITYRPLDAASLSTILDHHITELQRHVHTRLGERSFEIDVSAAGRQLLLEKGFNQEYGARELKRTIHRMLTQPLAALVAEGHVAAGCRVVADLAESGDQLTLRSEARPRTQPGHAASGRARPRRQLPIAQVAAA